MSGETLYPTAHKTLIQRKLQARNVCTYIRSHTKESSAVPLGLNLVPAPGPSAELCSTTENARRFVSRPLRPIYQ